MRGREGLERMKMVEVEEGKAKAKAEAKAFKCLKMGL